MLNCAVIMGRLTATPELRTTGTGISVTSFTVAVDRNFAKPGEERQTDFINVVAWRGTADFVTRFFQKGQMIAVQGAIQTRNYEDKNGNKRTAFEIVADNDSAEARVKAAVFLSLRRLLLQFLTRVQMQAVSQFYPMILRDFPSAQMMTKDFRFDLF